jgi:hypothetical protein
MALGEKDDDNDNQKPGAAKDVIRVLETSEGKEIEVITLATKSKKAHMMRMITIEDEMKIKTNYSRIDMNCLQKGCMNSGDIDHYMDFLQNKDDEKCVRISKKSHHCSTM